MNSIPRSKTPVILQNLQWVFNPISYMETNFQRYGDLFQAEIAPMNSEPMILVNHPEGIRYLLTQDNSDELTAPGDVNEIARPFVGGNSLLLLSGKQHQQRRKLLMPPLHGERMRVYGDLICATTRHALNKIQVGDRFRARDVICCITTRVISQAVFGLSESHDPGGNDPRIRANGSQEIDHQLEQRLAEWVNLISTPLTSVFFFFPSLMIDLGPRSITGRMRHTLRETDRLLYAKIRDSRAQLDPERTDVLSLLLNAQDEQGEGLSDQELRDELFTLLMAGHDTTANALTWALYWLHLYPTIHERLLEEIKPWYQSSDFTAISQLPYLKAFCQETLRIYPGPVTFPRRVEKDIQLMGRDIKAGVLLVGCVYLVHHREELYPNPNHFRPERFIERQFSPYEFLPFGGGQRRCIGAALAMYEMTLVLKTLLETCELELAEQPPIKPQRRGGILAPSDGVWLKKVSDRPA